MKVRTNTNHRQPTHEQIAERAHAIFEQSGRVPGCERENWLRAERELSAASREETEPKHRRSAATPARRQHVGSRA